MVIDRELEENVEVDYARIVRDLTTGTHLLEVILDNAKIGLNISIENNKNTEIHLVMRDMEQYLKGKNSFTLDSIPEGISFNIDGYAGFTGKTPFVFVDPIKTNYQVSFNNPRYQATKIEFVNPAAGKKQKNVELSAKFGCLKVSSEPSDAQVFLDGQFKGYTPLDLSGEENGLNPGTYILEIITDNLDFEPSQKQISIVENQTLVEHVDLKNILAELTIQADKYPVLVISNGVELAMLTKQETLKVRPGILSLEFIPSANSTIPLRPKNVELEVNKNQKRMLMVQLYPDKGELRIETRQSNLDFELHNSEFGRISPSKRSNALYAGTYSLIGHKWGYYSERQMVDIQEGELYVASFELEPIPKSLMSQHGSWKASRLTSLALLAAGLGASAYYFHRVDLDYENYRLADNPASVLAWRENYSMNRRNYYISVSVSSVSAFWYLFSAIKGSQASARIKNEMKSHL